MHSLKGKIPFHFIPFAVGNLALIIVVLSSMTFLFLRDRQEIIEAADRQSKHTMMLTEEAIKSELQSIDQVMNQVAHEVSNDPSGHHLNDADRSF